MVLCSFAVSPWFYCGFGPLHVRLAAVRSVVHPMYVRRAKENMRIQSYRRYMMVRSSIIIGSQIYVTTEKIFVGTVLLPSTACCHNMMKLQML